MKRSQLAVPVARFVHVDAAQLQESHEFELSVAPQLKAGSGEKCFKLKLLEHPLNEVLSLNLAQQKQTPDGYLYYLIKLNSYVLIPVLYFD